jgi:hypothetical protein
MMRTKKLLIYNNFFNIQYNYYNMFLYKKIINFYVCFYYNIKYINFYIKYLEI